MATYSHSPDPEGEKPPSFGIGKFLLVVLLAVIFFSLPIAWRITASLKATGSTGTAPSSHSRH